MKVTLTRAQCAALIVAAEAEAEGYAVSGASAPKPLTHAILQLRAAVRGAQPLSQEPHAMSVHSITETRSPVSVMLRCSCGWSRTFSTRGAAGNALARAAKVKAAKRQHFADAAEADRKANLAARE